MRSSSCFNALLAGGVCSNDKRCLQRERRFQCPLSGRGLQLPDVNAVQTAMASLKDLLAGGGCSGGLKSDTANLGMIK